MLVVTVCVVPLACVLFLVFVVVTVGEVVEVVPVAALVAVLNNCDTGGAPRLN